MRDIRGPDVPIPDSVPDELVAMYGAEARFAVRSRRSWRARQAARVRSRLAVHDPWYLLATTLLWLVIVVGFGGALTLAAIRWTVPVLDAGVLVGVAASSSALTMVMLRRREARRFRRADRRDPPRIVV